MEQLKIKPAVMGYLVKKYFLAMVGSFVFMLAGIFTFFGAIPLIEPFAFWIFLAGILFFIVPLIHSNIHCAVTSLQLEEDKLVYETGIINHNKKKIPVHMITDSLVQRSIIEKIFGFSTLCVNTGGNIGYEIVCSGFQHDSLDEMHKAIYKKINERRMPMQNAEKKQ